jgi:hypothetical protein
MMDYLLAGWKIVDIAKAMQCTPQNITDTKKQRLFQDELAQRRAILDAQVDDSLAKSVSSAEYVNERLSAGAKAAVDKLCGFVSDDATCSDAISRQSASDILDRAGYPKMTKTENTQNTIFVMDQDDLARIEETLAMDVSQESKILVKSETVQDATFETSLEVN